MLLGAITPFVLLLAYDLWAKWRQQTSADYEQYKNKNTGISQKAEKETEQNKQNDYGWVVLSRAMGAVGVLVIALGIIAQKANILVIVMGVIITGLAWLLHRRRHQLKKKSTQRKIYQ